MSLPRREAGPSQALREHPKPTAAARCQVPVESLETGLPLDGLADSELTRLFAHLGLPHGIPKTKPAHDPPGTDVGPLSSFRCPNGP